MRRKSRVEVEADDAARMTAAMRRLEELLQNPGPGITVSPPGEASRALYHRADEPEFEMPSMPAPATVERPEPRAQPSKLVTAEATPAIPAIEARAATPASIAPPKPQARTAKVEAPVAPPPQIAQPVQPSAQKPAAAVPRTLRKPSASSGGLFGIFLAWLLGPRDSEVKDAVAASRRAFHATFLFSAVINILMLAGPLFMLQVYDRVLTSSSFPTLVSLSIITACLYGIIGLLELARSRIIGRVGAEIDLRLSDRIFEASLRKSLATQGGAGSALRELDSFRQFISGPAPITFFDTPWTPVYLLVIFMAHWMLGVAATIGTIILLILAWMSEQRGRMPLLAANQAVGRSLEMADAGMRSAEAITSMGMLGAYRARWQQLNADGLGWQLLASDRLGGISSFTKAMRLLLQSLMLAIAAGLAITGQISAGSIIAATIIFGRALAPVEQIIGHWRGFIKARESFFKLEDVLNYAPASRSRTELPRPLGILDVNGIRVAAPESRMPILNGITFSARPGQMLAIIGPSASGKSTLARTIVGLWPPFGGTVMLDGARIDQWHPEDLGQHIGYLPQSVELFAGTVRQNICRFRDDATDEEVIDAATQAHAHELILALPNGYDTELGANATYLSGGQRQRIGLARALFRAPPLVVLDEPNANLDRAGDEALSAAIDGMRERGQTIVLVSHRVQAIGKADLLLVLERGQQRAFGPRAEVMKLFQPTAPNKARTDDASDKTGRASTDDEKVALPATGSDPA